jgi:uncharacterized MAPEG superfamily protein
MMSEYQSLTILTIFFMFAWVPVSIGKMKSFTFGWLATNRDTKPEKELIAWASRCDRAYNNLKDYFPAFAVAILVLGAMGKFDDSTRYASSLFLIGRIGHYVSYSMGYVPFRAIFFFTGLFANFYLLIKILI